MAGPVFFINFYFLKFKIPCTENAIDTNYDSVFFHEARDVDLRMGSLYWIWSPPPILSSLKQLTLKLKVGRVRELIIAAQKNFFDIFQYR